MSIPKYSADELKVIGSYPPPIPAFPPSPKYDTPISIRDNFDLLFARKTPVWIPDTGEIAMFAPKAMPDNVARGLIMDTDTLKPGEAGGKDIFGIEWEYVEQVGGSMVRPGKPYVGDIEHWEDYVTFPDFSKIDWAASAENAKPLTDAGRPVSLWILNGLFERLISFIDFEDAATALIDEDQQDAVHRLFDKLADMYDELIGIYHKYYDPYIIYFHDDWGSQRSPFFSLDTCMEMIVPYLKRIVDSCHRRGIKFELHCCGQVEMLVPAMIAAGVDTWSGQSMNDRPKLVREYGDKFIFGVPAPEIPEGTSSEEIRRLAEEFMETYRHPVILSTMGMRNTNEFRNAVYELSRKRYDAEAGN